MLRAKAHHLHPVVSIGQHGLTPAVLHEIDVSLKAHELIKVRVWSDARADRDAMLTRICDALDAAPVQHLGKLLIVWRPAPKEEAPAPRADKSAARKAPQARRPRTPLPRTPARPAAPAHRGRNPPARPPVPGSRRRTPLAKAGAATPHGKSASSKIGAAGARRRRRKAA